MYFFSAILVAIMLSMSSAAWAQTVTVKEAERLIDAGQFEKAEDTIGKLIKAEPNNARFHMLLADAYRKDGKYDSALSEYEKARKLGAADSEVLKGVASTHKRMKNYSLAKENYGKAIKANPKDEEAKDDLESLGLARGLKLRAMVGGWEPDYTKDSWEVAGSYGGFDKIDLNAGFSYADNIYYTRDKYYASAYYFYNPDSYVKGYFAYKDYDYPIDPAVQKPNPDTNSYDTVPTFEVEVSHWFTKQVRGTAAYEYFRPSFFYDQKTAANNHKVSTELYYITSLKWLRVKAMFALLRDPDPDKTEIAGRDNLNTALGAAASTDVQYQTQSLLGGGIEVVKDRWNADVKYIPNRDLDSSYDYSILAGVGYDLTDKLRGRFDYVYDKYSSNSAYSGETADVYLLSAFYAIDPSLDIGAGYKFISLPTTDESTGFLSLVYKTGFGF